MSEWECSVMSGPACPRSVPRQRRGVQSESLFQQCARWAAVQTAASEKEARLDLQRSSCCCQ